MDFTAVSSEIKTHKLAGLTFEREGQGKYRDRVTVYMDGKILFERFCYGEAAGLVFEMWGTAKAELAWEYDKCTHSQKKDAPLLLTGCTAGELYFDDKSARWLCTQRLKSDRQNGYSRMRVLLAR